MKSYKDLVKHYNFFNQWDSFLEEVFEENTSLIPYSHREMNVFQIEIDNPPSIKSIVDRNNEYFEELKDRFSKKALTNSNVYSLIEKELAEIQSYFTGNAYHLRYAPTEGKEDSFVYEFDLLENDLREGKIKGGDFSLFLVSEISAYCKYWDWLHSKEVSKFYYHFLTKVLFLSLHEIEKIVCPKAFSNSIDEKTPIKDFLMIEVILAFSHTTREIVTNLRQYKETLSDIEKEVFYTDVLDMANSFFLNNRTSINYMENAHSKKSEESKKEIYHGIKSTLGTKSKAKQKNHYFNWLGSIEKLELLFNALIEEELISRETKFSVFEKYFFEKYSKQKKETIQWTAKNPLLGYLFEKLTVNTGYLISDCEYASIIGHTTMFINDNDTILSRNNIKSSLHQSLKSGKPKNYKKIENIISQLKH